MGSLFTIPFRKLQDFCRVERAENAGFLVLTRVPLGFHLAHGVHSPGARVLQTGHVPDSSSLDIAVTLSLLRWGGDTRAARLLKELTHAVPPGDGRPAPTASPAEWPGDVLTQLAERLGIPSSERRAQISRARQEASEALASAVARQLVPVSWRDPAYPELLRHVPDPPIVLWTRGDPSALHGPAVAVVGSRAATPTGLAMARRLGQELGGAGLVVVSGMARGVDAAAHEGALDVGGRTVAILGCGADVVYPAQHAALARRIAETGVLASELPPGTPPRAGHFPLRNRIISGLAQAVVVIEASEKSGSLITARAALEQGREVLAVPGNVLSGRSRGCHALIRDGAALVEAVQDVFDAIRWAPARPVPTESSMNSLQFKGLEETMAVGEPYSVEDLVAQTGRQTPDLMAELGELELAGKIQRVAGGCYVRA
jgi:DNA processing protein